MTKYRIIEKENKLGKKSFDVQEKILFIFYIDRFIGYETLKDAKQKIDEIIFLKKNEVFKTIKKYKYNGPNR